MSLDNANWWDLAGETRASFVLGNVIQKAYCRRVSTHLEKRCCALPSHREYWYTSNVVTITAGPATPTPVQANYNTCGSGSFNIAVGAATNATSYNWYANDPTWDINGQGRSSISTTSPVARITPPAGVANGTYQIYVSSNGSCNKSPDATINITVSSGTPPASPTGLRWFRASGGICNPVYNLSASTVAGATSYEETDNLGNVVTGIVNATGTTVTFPIQLVGPVFGIVATVTATSSCGTSSAVFPSIDLAGPAPKCVSYNIVGVYPNPASDQLTVDTNGQAAVLVLYDSAGNIRQTVQIKEGAGTTNLNVLNMPSGTYHTKLSIVGQEPVSKNILIQH